MLGLHSLAATLTDMNHMTGHADPFHYLVQTIVFAKAYRNGSTYKKHANSDTFSCFSLLTVFMQS